MLLLFCSVLSCMCHISLNASISLYIWQSSLELYETSNLSSSCTPWWPKVTAGWPRVTLGDPGLPLGDTGWPLGDSGWPLGDPGRPLGDPEWTLGDPRWPLGDPGWPLGDPGWPLCDPGWPLGDPWVTQGDAWVTQGDPWVTQGDPFRPRVTLGRPGESLFLMGLWREREHFKVVQVFISYNVMQSKNSMMQECKKTIKHKYSCIQSHASIQIYNCMQALKYTISHKVTSMHASMQACNNASEQVNNYSCREVCKND